MDPEVTDNVDKHPMITYSKPPGSRFTKGVTSVIVSATDQSQNSETCAFKVTVKDVAGIRFISYQANKFIFEQVVFKMETTPFLILNSEK